MIVSVYTSTSNSHSSTSLLALATVRLLFFVNLTGVTWYIVVVLICISLIWVDLFPFLQLIWTTLSSQLTALPWSYAESRRHCAVSLPSHFPYGLHPSSSIGCFPLPSHLGQGCWSALWGLSKDWDMPAVDTWSFQGPPIFSNLQTRFQINPQLSSSLSLLPCPTQTIKLAFYGKKYPANGLEPLKACVLSPSWGYWM